eukprot:3023802-Prymnesium_polylepis.1
MQCRRCKAKPVLYTINTTRDNSQYGFRGCGHNYRCGLRAAPAPTASRAGAGQQRASKRSARHVITSSSAWLSRSSLG